MAYDTTEALNTCYKPYDIVSDKDGHIGFIKEVVINDCQYELTYQVQYSVHWMMGNKNKNEMMGAKVAWFSQSELVKHCNLFEEIAKASCEDSRNEGNVSKIMKLTNEP